MPPPTIGGSEHCLSTPATQQINNYIKARYRNSAMYKVTSVNIEWIAKIRKKLRYSGAASWLGSSSMAMAAAVCLGSTGAQARFFGFRGSACKGSGCEDCPV